MEQITQHQSKVDGAIICDRCGGEVSNDECKCSRACPVCGVWYPKVPGYWVSGVCESCVHLEIDELFPKQLKVAQEFINSLSSAQFTDLELTLANNLIVE